MENLISFELSTAELEQLRSLQWRYGRADLMAQEIVRDYLLRQRLKAARRARNQKIVRGAFSSVAR